MNQQALPKIHEPEVSLGVVLGNVERREGETRAAFAGRLSLIAAAYPEAEVPFRDFTALQDQVPAWNLKSVHLNGASYAMLEREVNPELLTPKNFQQHNSKERVIGIKQSRLIILTGAILKGADLAVALQIESDLGPGARNPIEKVQPAIENRTLSKLRLSEDERDVLRLAALPDKAIAEQLGVAPEIVRRRLHNMRKHNNVSDEQLFTAAVENGLVDLSLLPTNRKWSLSPRELKLVCNYAFKSNKETASELGYSSRSKSLEWRWRHALSKMHAQNRRQAFLLAYCEGLIS